MAYSVFDDDMQEDEPTPDLTGLEYCVCPSPLSEPTESGEIRCVNCYGVIDEGSGKAVANV